MKNYFLKKVMILAFAFGGLFMIGSNVFGNDTTTPILDPGDGSGGGGITCHQYAEVGRFNQCWKYNKDLNVCEFTGNMANQCFGFN